MCNVSVSCEWTGRSGLKGGEKQENARHTSSSTSTSLLPPSISRQTETIPSLSHMCDWTRAPVSCAMSAKPRSSSRLHVGTKRGVMTGSTRGCGAGSSARMRSMKVRVAERDEEVVSM